MFSPPTIEIVENNPSIYVLCDRDGNVIGAGSPDVIKILVGMSKRCEKPVADPPLGSAPPLPAPRVP